MPARIYGLRDYESWLERMALSIFGVSAERFVSEYRTGAYSARPAAADVASVLPIIQALRARKKGLDTD
jgi:hypothetical protein